MVGEDGHLLLDENNNLAPIGFKMGENGELSENIHTLDRSFFRIQQDVPYDEHKKKILEKETIKRDKAAEKLKDVRDE
jgi:hypothetical protein